MAFDTGDQVFWDKGGATYNGRFISAGAGGMAAVWAGSGVYFVPVDRLRHTASLPHAEVPDNPVPGPTPPSGDTTG